MFYIFFSRFFSLIGYYKMLQNIEYSPLCYMCYTVGPCWLSIILVTYFIYSSVYSLIPNS